MSRSSWTETEVTAALVMLLVSVLALVASAYPQHTRAEWIAACQDSCRPQRAVFDARSVRCYCLADDPEDAGAGGRPHE